MKVIQRMLLAGLLLLAPGPLLAQETQVPMDAEGRVLEIDRDLAARLGLFLQEHPDLRVARLFQATEQRYVLELELRVDDRVARQRQELSAAEVAELRQRVSARIAAAAPEAGMDQDGRLLFLSATTVLGLGFYGWAVPVALGIDDGRGMLAGYMITSAASFLGPYLYTSRRPVSYGMTNAYWWGATRGALHGLYAVEMLSDRASGDAQAAGAVAFSLVEGAVGFEWARRAGMSAGTAHTIGNFGDFGMGWTGATLALAQPDVDEQLVFGTLLAGSAAGLVAGDRIAAARHYTWGDAELMRAAFLVGGGSAVAVWDLVAGDDDSSNDAVRLLAGLGLLGSGAGVHVADRIVDGRDFSAGEGLLIDLGTVAGALLGVGVAALASPDGPDGDSEPFTLLGAAGAAAGFGLSVASLAGGAERRAQRERMRDERQGQLNVQFNPLALAGVGGHLRGDGGRGSRSGAMVPLLVARLSF